MHDKVRRGWSLSTGQHILLWQLSDVPFARAPTLVRRGSTRLVTRVSTAALHVMTTVPSNSPWGCTYIPETIKGTSCRSLPVLPPPDRRYPF